MLFPPPHDRGAPPSTSEVIAAFPGVAVDLDIGPLTGAHDRRHWEIAVATETARFRRYGRPYVIVVVDLDDLDTINSEHGNVAGEELLELTAVILKACVRPSDTVARLGDHDFAILAVECNLEGASALTTRVGDAFAAAGVRASLGVAVARTGRDGVATWAAAAAAMLDSKATLGSLTDTINGFSALGDAV